MSDLRYLGETMNGNDEGVEIAGTTWEIDQEMLLSVRESVFVREQGVPREIEVDGSDGECAHILAKSSDGKPVGTARLDKGGHIGRVAVLEDWRGRGIGMRLMEAAVSIALEKGFRRVELNSQTQASGFYEALGFLVIGDEFEEAGIPHVKMVREL